MGRDEAEAFAGIPRKEKGLAHDYIESNYLPGPVIGALGIDRFFR
jgi:hypothetical protein